MTIQKIGMRNIKTSIGIILCVIASTFIVDNALFAGLACVVSMQNTVKGSFKSGINRIKGTILGGVIGYICLLISPGNALLSGIGTTIVIYGCNIFKINSGILVSMVAFLSIHQGIITKTPEMYAIDRIWDTTIGVIIGVGVNYLLYRPNYIEKSIESTHNIQILIEEYIQTQIINRDKFDLKKMSNAVKEFEIAYKKLMDEKDYISNNSDIKNIKRKMEISKEIYNHMKVINSFEKELYLTSKNYNFLRNEYQVELNNWEVDELESPVFNYHLKKIIKQLQNMNKY